MLVETCFPHPGVGGDPVASEIGFLSHMTFTQTASLTLMSRSSRGLLSVYEMRQASTPSLSYSSCMIDSQMYEVYVRMYTKQLMCWAYLLPSKHMLVEVELKLLIGNIDTQLLE